MDLYVKMINDSIYNIICKQDPSSLTIGWCQKIQYHPDAKMPENRLNLNRQMKDM